MEILPRGQFINGQTLSGSGSPVNVNRPDFVGQLYHDLDADTYYRSTGLNRFQWTEMTGGDPEQNIVLADNILNSEFTLSGDGILTVKFDHWVEFGHQVNVRLDGCPDLTTVSFAGLIRIGNTNEVASACEFLINDNESLTDIILTAFTTIRAKGNLIISNNESLVTLPLSALASLGFESQINIVQNDALTSIDLSNLSVGVDDNDSAEIFITSNPVLVSITLTNFVVKNNATLDFTGNALNAATVNSILARCVASASFTAGTLDLSQGTNAAPTGQGIADVTTLTGRGVTVTTN